MIWHPSRLSIYFALATSLIGAIFLIAATNIFARDESSRDEPAKKGTVTENQAKKTSVKVKLPDKHNREEWNKYIAERVAIITDPSHTQAVMEADKWLTAIYELKAVGPDAVDQLIDALNKTKADEQFRLRKLGFALRAMDDKRAIPALIDAIPKTLQPPASDYGMKTSDDPLLAAFARDYQINAAQSRKFDKNGYSFGRPVMEIGAALKQLSNNDLGEGELWMVFLTGNEKQRELKRELFADLMMRRKKWWRAHQFELLGLPKNDAEYAKFFPTGADLVFERDLGYTISSVFENRGFATMDLDLGRSVKLPTQFLKKSEEKIEDLELWNREYVDAAKPNNETELKKWTIDKGVDLVGMQIPFGDDQQKYYVIFRCGLLAWELPSDAPPVTDSRLLAKIQFGDHDPDPTKSAAIGNLIQTLEKYKKPDDKFTLGRQVTSDFLIHWDEAMKQYDPKVPATFVVLTREGSVFVVSTRDQVRKLLTKADFGKPVSSAPKDKGPYRGVRTSVHALYLRSVENPGMP